MSKIVQIPSASIGVLEHYDVMVIGGGLAGICAALAAARGGAKTLLAESLPYIGGNATTGLPLSTFRTRNSPPVVVGGIPREIVEAVRALGGVSSDPAQTNWTRINGDLLQLALTQLLDDAGVTLLCHSPLIHAIRNEQRITHAAFCGPGQCAAYSARYFVDASGDAALAEKAGLHPVMGRARDGNTQPMTLTFDVGGIDQERFQTAGGGALMCRRFEELRQEMKWRNPRQGPHLSFPNFIPGRPGYASFNVTRILVHKGTDSRQLTAAEREGRYQVAEFLFRFLKPHIPGFEGAWLARIAHRVGVRETRRIQGEYELQAQDLLSCTKFDDSIACNAYPIDIHSPDGGSSDYHADIMKPGQYYTIPYRALVARNISNLLAAGRCISATHEALAAVRVFGCAMPVGEAAGTAAALCAAKGCAARDLGRDQLRRLLKANGAIID
ncbi:MAG: FAD-dependent oxidoreductase [Kiritimatiellales bacterium]|nr:FAD-dependent oxidoreductase [Kiritimatiellales bacterium]